MFIKKYNGDLLIFISMLIFGGYALFLRFFPSIPVLWFLFVFQIVATISFGIRSYKNKLFKVNDLLAMLIIFSILCLANDLCLFYAYRLTTIANATISHQMVSFFLVLLTPKFLGDKNTNDEYKSLLLSFIGIVIIFSDGLSAKNYIDILGIGLGVLSGLFYAFIIIGYIYFNKLNLDVNVVNFYRFALSTLIMVPFLPFFESLEFNNTNLYALLLFGLIFGFIAVALHTKGLTLSRPLHASIIGKTEPVIAILYSFIFLSEKVDFKVIFGGLLIVGSSIWLSLKRALNLNNTL